MAAIAARTTRIRIGSAGVMLPHYSALKVAEQFRVLEALAPGRIDLGVGRAPGGDMRTARALNPNADARAPRTFRSRCATCRPGRAARPPRRHHRASARAARARDLDPRQLRLRRAARGAFRPAVCLRLFLHRRRRAPSRRSALYRRLYQPSERHPEPQATLCIWALAAATDEEAQHLALSRDRWRIDRGRGVLGPLQSPDEIAARGFDAAEAAGLAPMRARAFVGSRADGARARSRGSPRRSSSTRSSSTPGPTIRRCGARRTRCSPRRSRSRAARRT